MFSPLIFGIFGFVVKSLFVLIIIIALIIGAGILYLKYKANKITKQYGNTDNSFSQNNVNYNNTEVSEEETFIDYSDSTIIDVDYSEEDKENK